MRVARCDRRLIRTIALNGLCQTRFDRHQFTEFELAKADFGEKMHFLPTAASYGMQHLRRLPLYGAQPLPAEAIDNPRNVQHVDEGTMWRSLPSAYAPDVVVCLGYRSEVRVGDRQ